MLRRTLRRSHHILKNYKEGVVLLTLGRFYIMKINILMNRTLYWSDVVIAGDGGSQHM